MKRLLLLICAILAFMSVSAQAQRLRSITQTGALTEEGRTSVSEEIRSENFLVAGGQAIRIKIDNLSLLLSIWLSDTQVTKVGLDKRIVYAAGWNAERVHHLLLRQDWQGVLRMVGYKATLRDSRNRAVTFEARSAQDFMQKLVDASDVLYGEFVRGNSDTAKPPYALVIGIEFDANKGAQ